MVTNQTRIHRPPANIELHKHKTQRTITKQGGVGSTAENEPRTLNKSLKKNKPGNSQPTLQEVWGLEDEQNAKTLVSPSIGTKRKAARNTSTYKRKRGFRSNHCHKCTQAGALVEYHTCNQACHAQCTESMPNNVRDEKVIWRCEECVRNKGHTDCSYTTWVEGFEHKEVEGDTTVWREDNPNVGRPVTKRFGTKLYKGIITRWMPGTKQEWELWTVKYEDNDGEDLDTHELVRILQNVTKNTESLGQTKMKKVTGTVMDTEQTKITRRGTDNTKRNQKKKRRTDGERNSNEDNKDTRQETGT
jgi:hypothetical protein